jgi:hypothetical protein
MIVRINNSFFNPPHVDAVNNGQNTLINAIKSKSINNGITKQQNFPNNMNNMTGNMNGNNFAQFGMPVNQAQRNLFMNNNKINPMNSPSPNGYHFKQMDQINNPDTNSNSNLNQIPVSNPNLRGSLDNSHSPNGIPNSTGNPPQVKIELK